MHVCAGKRRCFDTPNIREGGRRWLFFLSNVMGADKVRYQSKVDLGLTLFANQEHGSSY